MNDEKIWLAIVMCAVATLIFCNGWLPQIDAFIYNRGSWWVSDHIDEEVVLVHQEDRLIFQESNLNKSTNVTLTRMLQSICAGKPKAVVLNAILLMDSININANVALIRQLHECGNVVLPVLIRPTVVGEVPLEIGSDKLFVEAAAGVGRSEILAIPTGSMPGVYLHEGVGVAHWPLMADAILHVTRRTHTEEIRNYLYDPVVKRPHIFVRENLRLLSVRAKKTAYVSISINNLLAGDVPPSAFYNKVVMVGPNDGDILNKLAFIGNHEAYARLKNIADVYVGFRDQTLIRPISDSYGLLLVMVISVLPLIWTVALSPRLGLVLNFLWLLVMSILFSIVPIYLEYWLPPAGVLFAALLAYPLWSWRRLEAVQRLLDWQLMQLAGNQPNEPTGKLGYEQRLAHVQVAQMRYKDIQMQRDEMLAFFSHDIRGPLGTVSSQIAGSELADTVKQRLAIQLDRAHDLAQGFLSVIRAQGISTDSFEEVDLVMILHQSLDNFYEKSLQLKVKLVRILPTDPAWIKGDFDLLQRMFENLIQNALKYAPAYSEVIVQFTCDSVKRISVLDSGPGVAPEKMDKLFKKFAGSGDTLNGSVSNGLGLYFVHTVVMRHNGMCGYTPRTPLGSNFWIEF